MLFTVLPAKLGKNAGESGGDKAVGGWQSYAQPLQPAMSSGEKS